MRIDLHAHTTASDGTDSPGELVAAAQRAGLDVLAVTDHDTTAGWAEALAARPSSLTVVPGVELSCVHETVTGRRISLHLLGYLFDPHAEQLRTERAKLRTSREQRAEQMVTRLRDAGYPITWEQVTRLAAGGAVGRPHIAQSLVAAGAARDVPSAFTDVLSSRHPYFVPKQDVPVLEAIRLIRDAGGVVAFAHPLATRRGPVVDDEVIAAMAAAGLAAIEVDHPDQDDDNRAHAARLARELDLIPLGSSDYHGTNKPVRLGECLTDPAAYERLIDLATARRPVGG